MLFPDNLAKLMKKHKGESYRPSNGTEGEIFDKWFCHKCTKQSTCDISLHTLILDVSDPDYPSEWIINDQGQPTCTAFEKEPE